MAEPRDRGVDDGACRTLLLSGLLENLGAAATRVVVSGQGPVESRTSIGRLGTSSGAGIEQQKDLVPIAPLGGEHDGCHAGNVGGVRICARIEQGFEDSGVDRRCRRVRSGSAARVIGGIDRSPRGQ